MKTLIAVCLLGLSFCLAVSPVSAQVPRAGQRVRVSQKVMQVMIAKKVAPEYPADAKKDHVQGAVQLKVLIDKEGNVRDVQLINGHPALTQSAIDAVQQWKYKPYLLNGEPVEVETQVTVNFTLAD